MDGYCYKEILLCRPVGSWPASIIKEILLCRPASGWPAAITKEILQDVCAIPELLQFGNDNYMRDAVVRAGRQRVHRQNLMRNP